MNKIIKELEGNFIDWEKVSMVFHEYDDTLKKYYSILMFNGDKRDFLDFPSKINIDTEDFTYEGDFNAEHAIMMHQVALHIIEGYFFINHYGIFDLSSDEIWDGFIRELKKHEK